MAFKYSGRGISPLSGNFLIPAGIYRLKIIDTKEGLSKKGDPQVVVGFAVVGGPFANREIRFHNVTFFGRDQAGEPLPGAGIAVHFLKTIGQPWENDYIVNHLNWWGKELTAEVIEDEYNGKVNNKIKTIQPIETKQEVEEQVPF